jgi:hypothetical protein
VEAYVLVLLSGIGNLEPARPLMSPRLRAVRSPLSLWNRTFSVAECLAGRSVARCLLLVVFIKSFADLAVWWCVWNCVVGWRTGRHL